MSVLKLDMAYWFTLDSYRVPYNISVFEEEGSHYALLTRECSVCSGSGAVGTALCANCNGQGTVGPFKEKVVHSRDLSVVSHENYGCCPSARSPEIEAWLERNSFKIEELLKGTHKSFAESIQRTLKRNVFLTEKQLAALEEFYSKTFPALPVAAVSEQSAVVQAEQSIEEKYHRYAVGDPIKIKVSFSQMRLNRARVSGQIFYTFLASTNEGCFAISGNSQDHIVLGDKYLLSGFVKKLLTFGDDIHAVISVKHLERVKGKGG
ncbi:hypothetical protein U0129_19200 [Enterobacter hormaechei]|uniref:hypothetical protein n=1 Tax=Enterobacter hormaechei TaxID=158836 RepID=UPI0039C492D9